MKISFQNWKNMSVTFLGKKERRKCRLLRFLRMFTKGRERFKICPCCLHVNNHCSYTVSDQTTSQKCGGPAYKQTLTL